MPLDVWLREDLATRRASSLMRILRSRADPHGPTIAIDGTPLLDLSSNDYLGLACDPRLARALATHALEAGVGAAASRLLAGTTTLHRRAEAALALFAGTEAALLFGSGYAANLGLLQAVAGPDDLVLSDALNHASLIDGCRLSRARVAVYRHAEVDHARALLAGSRSSARRAFLVTDALFSMDGDRAPLAALRRLADEYDSALLVDEAHALGALGPEGRGACADAGVRPDALVGTLGKAFGVFGAFVAGTHELIALLENAARSFVYSTALPPAIAGAVLAAVPLVRDASARRAQLRRHAERLREAAGALGLRVPPSADQIVPVLVGDASAALALSAALVERGIFAPAIRPPTVPAGTSRLRLSPMATHAPEEIERVVAALTAIARGTA